MFVYCDTAATTPICRSALDAMKPYLETGWGNASGMYKISREAKTALENARRSVAKALGRLPEEIYFTSGGTESDNWAIKSGVLRNPDRKHIISSPIEHHAVSHTLAFMKKNGYEITELPVDENGQIDPEKLKNAIRPDTALVTIITANNEIGTILPINELAKIVKEIDKKIIFHTDAVQAIGHINIEFSKNVDIISFSGHKFGSMKGVGGQIIRKGLLIAPFIHGGGQERGRRASTENIAGIVGLAAALEWSQENLENNKKKTEQLRDYLISGILKELNYAFLTGDKNNRLPGNASFVFEAVEGESLVLGLDNMGVCGSSGSACSSASLDPSHVLLAIGLPHEIAHGSLRLSINETNAKEEMDYVINAVKTVVNRCRSMSPLWDETNNKPTERFWSK